MMSRLANAALAVALGLYLPWGSLPRAGAQAPGGAAPPPAKVITTAVLKREVAAGQTFVGTVKPLRKSTVGSAVPGRVEEFLVNEGDRVHKGQPIAKLRTGIIQAELDAAKADLKVRQAELEELENGARPEEITQAQARLAIAEAQRTFRRATRLRTTSLGTAASREKLEEDIAFELQSEAAYEEAQATLSLLREGPRRERIAQAQATVEAQAAEVQRLSEQLERHTMFAPFAGFVTAEHTEIGQWVMPGDPVAEIAELEQVDVEIPVVEDYIAGLREGTDARVFISALPREKFSGKVAIINPQADPRARTFPVKVRVANPVSDDSVLIKAGMFARVTLPVGKPVVALLVPKDAIVLGGPAPLVYVLEEAGDRQSVRAVPVTLGISQGTWIQVDGELQEGQQVVMEGNERLRPGQPVRAEPQQAPAE